MSTSSSRLAFAIDPARAETLVALILGLSTTGKEPVNEIYLSTGGKRPVMLVRAERYEFGWQMLWEPLFQPDDAHQLGTDDDALKALLIGVCKKWMESTPTASELFISFDRGAPKPNLPDSEAVTRAIRRGSA